MYRGNQTGVVGLNAVVSWPKTEWGFDPTGFDEMRPGSYDIHARVRDMDVNGITASMCFPTFAGFSAGHFRHVKDETTNAVIRAYNDWHIEDWCGAYPDRFLPLSIVPSWDPQEARRRDQARRRQGREGDHAARAPAHRRSAQLPRHGPLGPDLRSADRQRSGDVPAHRPGLRRAAARPRRAGRQPDDHGLPDLDARRAGPPVGAGVPHVPRAQGGVLRGRHRLAAVLPRPLRPALHQPGVAARRGRLRRQAAERGVPRARPRLLRHRPDVARSAQRDRHRHHRLGVRLPALRLDLARRPREDARRAERRRRDRRGDRQDHAGRTPAASSTGIRSRRGAARSTRSARCVPVRPTSTCRRRPARSTPSATRSPTPAAELRV